MQLQKSSKWRESIWRFINQGIGTETCFVQFRVLHSVHISHTAAFPRQSAKLSVWLRSTRPIWLPVSHSLSFESFVFVAFRNFGLRSFCFDVNWFLFSWREEDIGCDVLLQILLCFCPLHFLHLLHHLLLTYSSCCCKSDLPPVLKGWKERDKYFTGTFILAGARPFTPVHLKRSTYHVWWLEAWVFIECRPSEAALEDLDKI